MAVGPWSPREKEVLRSRWALNWRAETIGAELGRSPQAVWRMAWILKLPRREFEQQGVRIVKRRGRVPKTAKRTCLSCDRPFDSTGPGNRMCQQCRRKSADFLSVYA